jgi:hypothetical protein
MAVAAYLAPDYGVALASLWLSNPMRQGTTAQKKYPVFIVASEGGGIRAAIETAMVLDELRARYKVQQFDNHLFTIVGVSGGSVGAAAYAAALAGHKEPVRLAELKRDRSSGGWQAALHDDLVTPAIRSLFGPDFLTRFVPRAVTDLSRNDRAHALEAAFRGSWSRATGGEFNQAFNDVHPSADNLQPALILLTTDTSTGDRMAISHVRFSHNADDDLPTNSGRGCPSVPLKTLADIDPPSAKDPASIDVALVTAAFMSARFPLISPAARFEARMAASPTMWTAVTTKTQEFRRRETSSPAFVARLKMQSLLLSRSKTAKPRPRPRPADFISPTRLQSRERHGEAAIRQLKEDIAASTCTGCVPIIHVPFKLQPPPPADRVKLALSWFISPPARAEIARQLDEDNAKSFDQIGAILAQ